MNDEAKVAIAIFVITTLFTAGGLITWVKISLKEMKQDMNGIGRKQNDDRKDALRRHHNTSLAITQLAVIADEKNICDLLKED